MAKQAVQRKAAPPPTAMTTTAPQNAALAKLAQNFSIELAPFPQGDALAVFNDKAGSILVVTSKESHQEALEALRDGKALVRGIDEHWRKVLRWLEDRKKDIRAIMDADLAMADPHVKRLGALCVQYEDAERRRVQEEERLQREEQERIATENRNRELAKMDEAALKAEGQSDDLSDRERAFAQNVYLGVLPATAAQLAGFKDPGAQAVRLMKVGKVVAAIDGMRQAKALRDQAAATAEKPLEVKKVEVASNVGKVAGVRTTTTWTGECFDYRAFALAFQNGAVDLETFLEMSQPSETGGNAKARAMHENLDRIIGWRHIKKETK